MVRLTGSCANWLRLRLVAMRCTCASIRPGMSVLPWQSMTCACGTVLGRSEISRIISPSTRTCMSSRTSGDVPSQRVQCVRTMRLIGVSPTDATRKIRYARELSGIQAQFFRNPFNYIAYFFQGDDFLKLEFDTEILFYPADDGHVGQRIPSRYLVGSALGRNLQCRLPQYIAEQTGYPEEYLVFCFNAHCFVLTLIVYQIRKLAAVN